MSQDSKATYVQLSKPYFTSREIDVITRKNVDLSQNIRNFKSKTKETFQILTTLIIKLKLPIRVLQNSSYFYQKFYLLNNNYKKYSNLHFEVGLAVLFISLKLNDYIKKVSVVISEAFTLKGNHLSSADIEENKKIIISLERKILEFQSFDFRNFLVEDFLIKFLKFFNAEKQDNGEVNANLHNGDTKQGNKLTSKKTFSYLSWCILNDLYLTSLVLQYPAHYNAMVSIKCASIIYNELIKDAENLDLNRKPINWDLKKLIAGNKSDLFIIMGCNQLLEYYIDNIGITFLKTCLAELDFKIEEKKLVDLLLNIKIDLNSKIPSHLSSDNTANSDDDLFFHTRDTDIAKNGSIRFLYNKQKFTDEVSMYNK